METASTSYGGRSVSQENLPPMETASTSCGGGSVSQVSLPPMETASTSHGGRYPPGFRFKPTDEELIMDHLVHWVKQQRLDYRVIAEVDVSKFHPRQLPEKALLRSEEEYFFFTQLEKKYPKGNRPNRAAGEGYWKATGTDRKIYRANPIGHGRMLVGLKKALVFYEGKAPQGKKTNWIMHEYRLADPRLAPAAYIHHPDSAPPKEWVVCRIYEKHSRRAVDREVDLDSMLSEFDNQITADSPTQEQGAVDNATISAAFPAVMLGIPGAMSSMVPGMQQTVPSSHGWTWIDSSTPNYVPQMLPFHRDPGSSSFTGHDPQYSYNACIVTDARQRSSFSGELEVQSQFANVVGYGEGALVPGLEHPLADDQSSTYPSGNFGYGHALPRRNS